MFIFFLEPNLQSIQLLRLKVSRHAAVNHGRSCQTWLCIPPRTSPRYEFRRGRQCAWATNNTLGGWAYSGIGAACHLDTEHLQRNFWPRQVPFSHRSRPLALAPPLSIAAVRKRFRRCSSLLLDGCSLIDIVTLDVLTRAIFKPRRPQDGAITLLRLCEPTDNGYRLRWDEIFLKPGSKVGDIANQRVRECLADCKPAAISLIHLGDTLLIDNWRMLHARAPIPAGRENRKIERIYLEGLN